MIVWLDAQLPADLAPWLHLTFGVEAWSVRELGLRDASDPTIYAQAGESETVVVFSKDSDLVELAKRLGPPPRVVRVACGNATRAETR